MDHRKKTHSSFSVAAYGTWTPDMLGVALAGMLFVVFAVVSISPARAAGVLQAADFSAASDAESSRPFRIPMILNDRVEGYIDYFTTERTTFQAALDNSMPYLQMMKSIFRDANLPEELVYVAMIESWFDATAVSRASAVGLWQFMSATGREYGLRTDNWVDERRDTVKSTFAAARYFRQLYSRLQSWTLVLAAYNAGMGRVREAIFGAGSNDFWDLAQSGLLSRETRRFVPKFMAAAIIATNPAAYGFRVPAPRTVSFDVAEVIGSRDLRSLAREMGITYAELRALNPEILGMFTPPGNYLLKIPTGSRLALGMTRVSARNESSDGRAESAVLASGSQQPASRERHGRADDKPLVVSTRNTVLPTRTGKQRKSRAVDRSVDRRVEQEAKNLQANTDG